MKITAIILTYNEEIHLERCICSLQGVVDCVVVVDCFSTDATLEIAARLGASVIQKQWINHSEQFNWALTQLDIENTEWVLRIDADEYITPSLARELREVIPTLDPTVNGIYVGRRMTFLGRPIRYGGVFPVQVLRLMRYGYGRCEYRWMDEHIKVLGNKTRLNGEIIDDNRKSLTWWISKHNKYSNLEALEMLNLEYKFMHHNDVLDAKIGEPANFRRWMKERVYANLPNGFRAFLYFFYRYFLRFGFLDGNAGAAFHFLQGFWYRYLVDIKIIEVKKYMDHHKVDVKEAIYRVFDIKI